MHRLPLISASAAGILLATLAGPSRAATRLVPESYATVAAAVADAQNGDTISVGPGTFSETLFLDKDLTIVGAGATRTVLTASSLRSVVSVDRKRRVLLKGLALTGGYDGRGGGVYNEGDMTLERCVITRCEAFVEGGGLANANGATALLTDCIVSGNKAPGGAGLYNSGKLELNRCTVMSNTAVSSGGGAYLMGRTTLRNTTVSGNSAWQGGGLFVSSGARVNLNNVTTSANSATDSAGGIYVQGDISMANSIVAENSAPTAPDALGAFQLPGGTSATYNLIGNDSGVTDLPGSANIRNRDAKLGDLSYNTDMRAYFSTVLASGLSGVADAVVTGAPDGMFVGLGSSAVVYDFGANVVLNEPGPDLNVYEVNYGVAEFNKMSVSVSLDGIHFIDVKSTEGPLVRVPGDAAYGSETYARSYDLAPTGLPFARYIKIEGFGGGTAGGTVGFDLDAIAAIHTALVPSHTLMHRPLPQSPALNAGGSGREATDQRGVLRSQDGGNTGAALADIGAMEVRSRYVVTNTNDTGAGSLRAALAANDAREVGDGRVIFAIPGPGPYLLHPSHPLVVEKPVFIDGWSQPGFDGHPIIEIAGGGHGMDRQLVLGSRGSTVRGLSLSGHFSGYALMCAGDEQDPRAESWIYGNTMTGNLGGITVMADGYHIGSNLDGVNDEAEANMIASNSSAGISVSANRAIIAGNIIGADITGTLPRPNGSAGVRVASSSGNSILRNRIAFNEGLGIDLQPNGVTPNDDLDVDTGPNGLQNFPVISSAVITANATRVTGVMNSSSNTLLWIEFFENGLPDPSGYGQGQKYLGGAWVTTGADGAATFHVMLPRVTLGTTITATATGPDGSTSEFGPALTPGYGMADAAMSLKIAAGLSEARELDVILYGFGSPNVTLKSVARITRMASGMPPGQ